MAPAAGNHDTEGNQHTVFIDTSLDTHLATMVSDSDTVSDFKNRIMLEHHQCFPAIGDIKIEYLKVKRRGTFYRLSDSMLVKNAFAATKKNWFVSVDASRLKQDDGVQHLDEHKAGDQLALPWATGADSRSIDRHDNHADKPSNLALEHGSPSSHHKIAPLVNQKVSNVNQLTWDDSCKDVLKQERSSNDKQLDFEVQEKVHTVSKDTKSKKRTRDVHSESLLVNDSGTRPSMKKKRKIKRVKSDGKGSEENMVLTCDSNKIKHNEASISDENFSKQKSKGKDLIDENTRINKGENFSNLDQVATAVPFGVEDVGEEARPHITEASVTVADVAMAVEKNIRQETPFDISEKETRPRNTEASETVADVAMVVEKNIQQERPFGISAETCPRNTEASETVADVAMVVEKNIQQDMHLGISGSEPSVKKKGKSKRVKRNVKASEENMVLTNDSNKVKDNEASINNENSFEQKSKGEDLSDENTRINKSKSFFNLDQVATAVPSGVEDVGKETCPQSTEPSETVANVARVMEKNIQQETPFGIFEKENDNEPVENAGTCDYEHDAPGLTSLSHPKGSKRSTKHKAAEKESSSTSSIKKLNNVNKDATDSSLQQDVGYTVQESTGDHVDKHKEDNEVLLKQGPQEKHYDRKLSTENLAECKRTSRSAVQNKDELLVKHAADNLGGNISSLTVAASGFGDRNIDERSEVSEKSLVDAKKGDDVIVKEVEISKPTENQKSRVRLGNLKVKSRKESKDTLGSSKKRKDGEKSASRNDEKQTNDAGSVTNEEKVLPQSETKQSLDILSRSGKNIGQVDAEKQNENMDDAKKKKRKTKKKSSAERNENESIRKLDANGDVSLPIAVSGPPLDGHLHGNANKDGQSSLLNADRKDGDKLKGEDKDESTETLTVSDVSKIRMEGRDDVHNEPKDGSHKDENMDDAKKKKRKTKKKSSAESNENKSIRKHDANGDVSMPTTVCGPPLDGHLHDNAKKEGESSLLDADSKDGDKMKGEDKDKSTETLTVSDVSKIRTEGRDDVHNGPKDGSHEDENMNDAKKKKRKTKKKSSAERNENESIRKLDANGDVSMPTAVSGPPLDGHLHGNAKKVGQSSLLNVDRKDCDQMKGEDKDKSTETRTVSEVSKIRMEGRDDVHNEPNDGSHEIDFMDYFAPARQPNMIAAADTIPSGKKKPKSKTQDLPLVQASPNTSIQSQKFISKPKTKHSKVSTVVVKEPNMCQVKAPKGTTKIDAKKGDGGASEESSSSSSSSSESFGISFYNQKSNKQQSILGQSDVKTVKKSSSAVVNGSQQVKSLLNTPGTIFGDDGSDDDNESVDSDSSTRTPSRKSSSSSSRESDSNVHSRRNGSHAMKRSEGGGKNGINTQSKLKNRSMAELLRSSSRFKKAKFSASQQMEDTESQPIDFVPDSQPHG